MQNFLVTLPNGPFGVGGSKAKGGNGFRAGDWICLGCKNLNFSFREVCNRCLIQTKSMNFQKSLNKLTESLQDRKSTVSSDSHSPQNEKGDNYPWITPSKGLYSVEGLEELEIGEMRPYVSPAKLPSVSPILKSLRSGEGAENFQIKPFSLSE